MFSLKLATFAFSSWVVGFGLSSFNTLKNLHMLVVKYNSGTGSLESLNCFLTYLVLVFLRETNSLLPGKS